MPSPEPECVFRMGVEGGGVDFFRQWNFDGAWRFTFKGSSGGIEIDDDWKTWSSTDTETPGVYMTLDDAIAGFSSDGDWVHWSVINVHPDYKEYVWQLRERTIESANGQSAKRARKRDHVWAKKCGQRVPKSVLKTTAKPMPIVVRPGGTLDQILGTSIAVMEHLRKEPLSEEEVSEFEATMIRVLETRRSEHRKRVK